MRKLLLTGVVAIVGFTFIAPASARDFWVDTPVGSIHVGKDRHRYYDRSGYDAYGYAYRGRGPMGPRNCGPGMNSDGYRCVPIVPPQYR
jgi:hypothetical protein